MGASGCNLKDQINDLVDKGILHPLMKDWADEVRILANESAHDGMKRFWIQAHHSLTNENWDAANVMARSAVQFVVRDKKGKGGGQFADGSGLALSGQGSTLIPYSPVLKPYSAADHNR
jgi:hypothetical protein